MCEIIGICNYRIDPIKNTHIMNEWAESIIEDARVKMPDIISKKYVDKMWLNFKTNKKYSNMIWSVLMLEQWMME